MKGSSSGVFINCPFDDEYLPLFRAVVFTVEACGFSARSALEKSNSGESRFEKIVRILRETRFGIHDISRTEANAAGLPRFNMPFELGLFLGMRSVKGLHAKKVALILDRDRYRYQQFLSDLAGHDIGSHEGNVDVAIGVVRNWLGNLSIGDVPGGRILAKQYREFCEAIPAFLHTRKLTHHDLKNFPDFHGAVRAWVTNDDRT